MSIIFQIFIQTHLKQKWIKSLKKNIEDLAFNDRIKILWGFSFNPFLKPRSWGNENSMLRWITNPPKVILSIVNRISQIYLCEWYRHSINSPIQVTSNLLMESLQQISFRKSCIQSNSYTTYWDTNNKSSIG